MKSVPSPCPLCLENSRQQNGDVAGAVGETATGWIRLHSRQRYRGATFFVAKACVREAHHLDEATRRRHFDELSEVCRAVEDVFAPVKLNVESLGNSVPHLHWWITPRHDDDPDPRAPIWENSAFTRDFRMNTGHAPEEQLTASANALGVVLAERGLIL